MFYLIQHARDSKFQLELALEHREFINGKKNGKINKIIKQSGSKVSFQETFKGYNMMIEIQNTLPSKALEGLLLLQDEMPAEISFFIPESYHKRIIGVGGNSRGNAGKNIQRIMKKYGVYVKFSNAAEYAALGGYFENTHNVIARTPAKNSDNLALLQASINELVARDRGTDSLVVKIPRLHHRVVVGVDAENLKRISTATNTEITFPSRDGGSDDVIVIGDTDKITLAQTQLLVCLSNSGPCPTGPLDIPPFFSSDSRCLGLTRMDCSF